MTVVFSIFSWMPTISTSLPTSILPCSMRPVTTVPRPVIVNTSSIGIRNGLSTSRSGSGMYESTASMSSTIFARPLGVALERLERRDADDRDVVAGEVVLGEELAHLHLDELEELLVVDHVGLVEGDDHRRHLDLAREQDVLARLRHRAVGGRDHEDRAVHLGGARDHVLDVVGVPGAVDVRVVAVRGLVLDVRGVDRDAALALLGSGVDRREVALGGARPGLGEHLGDRRGQGRLAVVDVTDRADVDVRLRPLELLLCHCGSGLLPALPTRPPGRRRCPPRWTRERPRSGRTAW